MSLAGNKPEVEIQNLRNQVVVNETPVEVVVSLVGQQGARGGTLLFGESSPPSASLGQPGDLYIDTSSKLVWGPKGINVDTNIQFWPEAPSFTFGASARHVYNQPTPSSSWVFDHPLGGKPSVTVVDSAETVVIGEVSYISNTQIRIDFSSPFSGSVYLT
jgi:hypothetical protein